MTFALKGGYVVSKMLTYVYIGSVGPFENVYISKNKQKIVNFSLFLHLNLLCSNDETETFSPLHGNPLQ